MGPAWGSSGADRTQVGPMLAPWTLLSRIPCIQHQSEYPQSFFEAKHAFNSFKMLRQISIFQVQFYFLFTELYRGCFDGWMGTLIKTDYEGCRLQYYINKFVEWCFCTKDRCNGASMSTVAQLDPDYDRDVQIVHSYDEVSVGTLQPRPGYYCDVTLSVIVFMLPWKMWSAKWRPFCLDLNVVLCFLCLFLLNGVFLIN